MNLPETLGNTPTDRILKVYSLVWKDKYGFSPEILNFPKYAKMFKPLIARLGEYQLASLILLHFEWRGANGDDNFIYRQLENHCFPLEWVIKSMNAYKAFYINNLRIDIGNESVVKLLVDNALAKL